MTDTKILLAIHRDQLEEIEAVNKSKLNFSHLSRAVKYSSHEIVELILRSVNIESRDHLGRTALHVAVIESNYNTARFLISQGANINSEDYSGMRIIHDVFLNILKLQLKEISSVFRHNIGLYNTPVPRERLVQVARNDLEFAKFLIDKPDYHSDEASFLKAKIPFKKRFDKLVGSEQSEILITNGSYAANNYIYQLVNDLEIV